MTEYKSNAPAAILARFDRWFEVKKNRGTYRRGRIEDARDLLFYEWLNRRSDLNPDEREAAEVAYEKRAKRAAEAEAFIREEMEQEQRNLEVDRRAEAALLELSAMHRQDVAAKAEQARRDEARRQLETRLADPAWVRGEDPASLRGAVLWLKRNKDRGLVALTLSATDDAALNAALAAILGETKVRQDEIAAAQRQQAAEGLARQARGEPPVPIPLALSFQADPDAVARWLVAHADSVTYVGRERSEEITAYDDNDKPYLRQRTTTERPQGWDAVAERCGRWATWARLDAEATGLPETEAATLRALAGDAVLDGTATGAVGDVLRTEHGRWRSWPARPLAADDDDEPEDADEETRTTAKGRRHAPVDPFDMREAIRDFIRTFTREHHRGASKNEIAAGVRGRKKRVLQLIDEMTDAGELRRELVKGQPTYRLADE